MKFTTVFVALAAVAATISARPSMTTNAERLARGLPPLPPVRRATGVSAARRATSSGISSCSNLCCNSVGHANDGTIGLLLGLLGVIIRDPTVLIGVTCSPNPVGGSCSQQLQPVCCVDNTFNGVIAIGCTPTAQNS